MSTAQSQTSVTRMTRSRVGSQPHKAKTTVSVFSLHSRDSSQNVSTFSDIVVIDAVKATLVALRTKRERKRA